MLRTSRLARQPEHASLPTPQLPPIALEARLLCTVGLRDLGLIFTLDRRGFGSNAHDTASQQQDRSAREIISRDEG